MATIWRSTAGSSVGIPLEISAGRRPAGVRVGDPLHSAGVDRGMCAVRPGATVCEPRAFARPRARGCVGCQGLQAVATARERFKGFIRDEYTTLPDLNNRPLHMWLDIEWKYTTDDGMFSGGRRRRARVRQIVREYSRRSNRAASSRSFIRWARECSTRLPQSAEVQLEANNRTWDTIAEIGDTLGVYTDARPPYGCLGLTLKRLNKYERSS